MPPDDRAPKRRTFWVGWLVPIVAVSIVVGVVGALATTAQFAPPAVGSDPTPPATLSQDAIDEYRGGSLPMADMWFDGTVTPSDSFPYSDLLRDNGINKEDVRFALNGVGDQKFWVANAEGKLCLLVVGPTVSNTDHTGGEIFCAARIQFDVRGIDLTTNDVEAQWRGSEVITVPPTNPEPTVPPAPVPGNGDIDAANSWFDGSPAPSDTFPYEANLMANNIEPSHVRLAVSHNRPYGKVWVAQQGLTGFCLIVTTTQKGYTSQMNCAPLEEFRASGLSIAVPGLAAFWDGNDVSTTR